MTQISRHRGAKLGGGHKGSLTHGKKTPGIGGHAYESGIEKDWIPKLQARYERRNREGKSRMLDELCEDYGYERKYAIKLLKGKLPVASLEADSVAHCGGSMAGDFIWSLTHTDILSGWTEGAAVWNKGATGVLAATRVMEEHLPFGWLGFDSDNGGEFLNHHLWAYLRDRKDTVEFARSRPYHSDDKQATHGPPVG